VAGGVVVDQRLGQPLADVGLAAHAGGAQLVDADAGDHRGQVGARRLDLRAVGERAVEAEEPLLHGVLRLAHAAEHPVGDRERGRSQVAIELVVHPSPSANPVRQLA
jgi:hypothetical protein